MCEVSELIRDSEKQKKANENKVRIKPGEESNMKQWLLSSQGRRAIKFVFIGGFVTLLGIIGLYFLVDILSIQKNLAYFGLTIVSLQLNFFLSVRVTWAGMSEQDSIKVQWLKYHLSRGVVAFLNQLLFALLGWLGLAYMIANLVCIAISTGLNFLAGELVVFAPGKRKRSLR